MKALRNCFGGRLKWMLLALSAVGMALPAQAQDTEAVAYLPQVTADIMWLLLAGFLVFFMQAGFAMVEAGLTRSKNASNIMMKNLMDFSVGAIAFWAIGYSLMYGSDGAFIGWSKDLLFLGSANAGGDMSESASWLFQVVFAATAATIVSGAMAERTHFVAYCCYSLLISAVLYPIAGHWIWGGGWLGAMNMRDFAGSTVVHSVGAWAALAGCILIGPRKGKYGKDGKINVIPGHNMPLAALGVFILWFGWYGFNPGSTLAAVDGIAHVAVTTTLAAAGGAIAAMLTTWFMFKKPDLSMTLNGALAGLVGITAPCASVSTSSAVIIGLVAGILVVLSCLFFERVLKIDDPVGAISVHGVCGAWGTLAVGLFGQQAIDVMYWDSETCIQDGLFFGGGFHQLGIQALGVVSVFGFVAVCAFIMFSILKATVGLRVSEEDEAMGLDLSEHGAESYPDFVTSSEHK
ncbi:ammonium transporter [Ruficoccus sp. ZRK36]|uniref:ammonium transporter n=1 Tax=Ruficoccus sp. ZRK36 TaxID=2866311 RepID=UPI00210698C6|nr:ammonium transporter [Ruficoccus sp. ZRK36]